MVSVPYNTATLLLSDTFSACSVPNLLLLKLKIVPQNEILLSVTGQDWGFHTRTCIFLIFLTYSAGLVEL